jgi:hypothetical protein
MAEPHDLLKARRESAALLNLGDVERLSPADALRCDLVSTLRLAIDGEQATVLDGGSADLAKLITATENLIRLLPGRALPEPESSREDPRQVLWQIYKQMRERGEINLKPEAGLHLRIAELTAEVAELKARLVGKTSIARCDSLPITPPLSDIVPPSERAECDAGPRAGPDDWRAPRPGPVIDGKASATAAPRNWDETDNGKRWQAWHDASGSVGGDRWANRNIP